MQLKKTEVQQMTSTTQQTFENDVFTFQVMTNYQNEVLSHRVIECQPKNAESVAENPMAGFARCEIFAQQQNYMFASTLTLSEKSAVIALFDEIITQL